MAESKTDWRKRYLDTLRELEDREKHLDAADELLRQTINRFGLAVADSYPRLEGDVRALRDAARKEAPLEELGRYVQGISQGILEEEAHRAPEEEAHEPPAQPELPGAPDLPGPARALARLMESVVFTDELEEDKSDLLEALAGPVHTDDLGTLIERGARLVNRMRRQLQQEKYELSGFLGQLTGALSELDRFLDQDCESLEEARASGQALREAVSGDTDRLQAQLADPGDIERLEAAVRHHVERIRQHMEEHHERERDRLEAAESRNRQLRERLEHMESESEELRETLRQSQIRLLRDPLTEIHNRLAFDERLRQELARWKRTGSPFSLAVIDIDHFKRINDEYGHKAGDKALRIVARQLAGSVRETDFLARYGGEEFVLLMPETPAEAAEGVAEKLRQGIADTAFRYARNPLAVTVSCGVTGIQPEDDEESVFARADEALYAAKGAGRNRVIAA